MRKVISAASVDANLDAGKNVAPMADVQSKSVGTSPRARRRKVSEVQGLKKIMTTTLSNMDKGLR